MAAAMSAEIRATVADLLEEVVTFQPWVGGNYDPVEDALAALYRHAGELGHELPVFMPVSPKTRRQQADRAADKAFRRIGERDGFRCRVCDADRTLTIDHVIAVVNGGTDDDDNMQMLCRSHNSQKGTR